MDIDLRHEKVNLYKIFEDTREKKLSAQFSLLWQGNDTEQV